MEPRISSPYKTSNFHFGQWPSEFLLFSWVGNIKDRKSEIDDLDFIVSVQCHIYEQNKNPLPKNNTGQMGLEIRTDLIHYLHFLFFRAMSFEKIIFFFKNNK